MSAVYDVLKVRIIVKKHKTKDKKERYALDEVRITSMKEGKI